LVAAAKREASALDHNWIGTEHLLLAVIKDATRELRSLLERHDLDYERIEASVELLLRSRGPD
jgi:ATP-dependent Clp protease ATP-binding subunit ClpA